MEDIKVVYRETLPEGRRNIRPYIAAAKARPGVWVEMPFPSKEDKSGSIVSNCKRHGLEGTTRNGVIFIRQPA